MCDTCFSGGTSSLLPADAKAISNIGLRSDTSSINSRPKDDPVECPIYGISI